MQRHLRDLLPRRGVDDGGLQTDDAHWLLRAVGGAVAEVLETRGDFVRRLVGEREDADSVGFDSKVLNEESNALDEAERLPRTRSGEDEDRP